MSLRKNETLTRWTLLDTFCLHFWAWLLLYSAITPKNEDKKCPKVFNVSEFHFSEVTFFQNWYFSSSVQNSWIRWLRLNYLSIRLSTMRLSNSHQYLQVISGKINGRNIVADFLNKGPNGLLNSSVQFLVSYNKRQSLPGRSDQRSIGQIMKNAGEWFQSKWKS